jgi:hypothetical protein
MRRLAVLTLAVLICGTVHIQSANARDIWVIYDFLCATWFGSGCCGIPGDDGLPSGSCGCAGTARINPANLTPEDRKKIAVKYGTKRPPAAFSSFVTRWENSAKSR